MSLDTKKTILITGSSRGIGLQTTIRLLEKGYKVIGLSRTKPHLSHPFFTFYPVDLEKIDTLDSLFKQLLSSHKDISVLILNAGIGLFGYLEQLKPEQLTKSMNVNFISQALLCHSFITHLKNLKSSDIIFIGSEAALQGGKAGSFYAASKFALRGFAQSIKQECLKSHVRVSLIHPGMVRTHFYENCYFEPGAEDDQALSPQDIAHVILHILSSSPGVNFDEITLNPLKKVIAFKNKPYIGTQEDSLLKSIKTT